MGADGVGVWSALDASGPIREAAVHEGKGGIQIRQLLYISFDIVL